MGAGVRCIRHPQVGVVVARYVMTGPHAVKVVVAAALRYVLRGHSRLAGVVRYVLAGQSQVLDEGEAAGQDVL